MKAKFEELIEGFVTGNVGISETFLSLRLAAALRQNLLHLNATHQMVSAGIGNQPDKDKGQKTRSDKTCWLGNDPGNHAEDEFLDMIREFVGHLNGTCYTGLNAFEFHYALYEEGAFYKRHKDQFKNNDNRKYSLISYLNENWTESDGGQLIIHDGESKQYIVPGNQKAVFFQSNKTEHEVAVANRARMSVTGWLKQV